MQHTHTHTHTHTRVHTLNIRTHSQYPGTLEVFVKIDNYNERGVTGQGIMGIQRDPDVENRFDSIIYGDEHTRSWKAASSGNSRTQFPLLPRPTPAPVTGMGMSSMGIGATVDLYDEVQFSDFSTDAFVHIAITYSYSASCDPTSDATCPGTIQMYRNGQPYVSPPSLVQGEGCRLAFIFLIFLVAIVTVCVHIRITPRP